ncbi:MAG TPA: nucleotidyltransferase domain-containing protein [Dissulfurispiraceae bacterium]|nr:nucleotidyltransferase domain-containing protein [Dissulfurispiraceae bacterium]
MRPVVQDRETVLEILRKYKQEFERLYGITALGVFGSVARGEAQEVSDVDVVVRMREPNLFFMVHIKNALEESLHSHVDIIRYREKMNPSLKKRIDRDAVYV